MTIKATFRDGVTENEYTMEFESRGECERRLADMGYYPDHEDWVDDCGSTKARGFSKPSKEELWALAIDHSAKG